MRVVGRGPPCARPGTKVSATRYIRLVLIWGRSGTMSRVGPRRSDEFSVRPHATRSHQLG